MVELNGKVYPRCPRAIYLESIPARYLAEMYFRFKQTSQYPYPGTYLDMTNYLIEAFDYIAEMVMKYESKQRDKANPKQE